MLGKMAFFLLYNSIIFILHEWILIDLDVFKLLDHLPMCLIKWLVLRTSVSIYNHLLARVPQQRTNQSQPIYAGSGVASRPFKPVQRGRQRLRRCHLIVNSVFNSFFLYFRFWCLIMLYLARSTLNLFPFVKN